jgi:hypothetical protein
MDNKIQLSKDEIIMGFVASCVEDGYGTGQRPKGCWPVFLPRGDVADV